MTTDGIYRHDPLAAPDRDFEPGTLEHLVPSNAGRMLDPRRTPVTILGLDLALGTFELRVEDFEAPTRSEHRTARAGSHGRPHPAAAGASRASRSSIVLRAVASAAR